MERFLRLLKRLLKQLKRSLRQSVEANIIRAVPVRGISRRSLISGWLALAIASGLTLGQSKAMLLLHGGGGIAPASVSQSSLPTIPPLPSDVLNITFTGTTSGGISSEGAASSWTIATASSTFASLNGTTYTTLDAIQNAATAGSFGGKPFYARFVVASPPLNVHQSTPITFDTNVPQAWGTDNIDDVVLQGGNGTTPQQSLVVNDATKTSILQFKNLRFGAFQSEIDADNTVQKGNEALVVIRGGIVVLNRCRILRCRANGMTTTTAYEWDQRAACQVWSFFTEFAGCGAPGSGLHNIYNHALKFFYFKESHSHSAGNAHALKIDNNGNCIEDSCIEGNVAGYPASWGTNAPPVDMTLDEDVFARRNIIRYTTNTTVVRQPWRFVGRRNDMGHLHTKVPCYNTKNTGPPVNGQGQARLTNWVHGGLNGPEHTAGEVTGGPYSTGATSINLNRVGAEQIDIPGPAGELNRNLSDTTAHGLNVLLLLDSGVCHSCTATITAHGAGTLSIVLDTPLPSSLANARPVAVKYLAQHWDENVATAGDQEELLNPAHIKFYPDRFAGSDGKADFTKQRLSDGRGIPTAYLEDNMFVLLGSAITPQAVLEIRQDAFLGYHTTANRLMNMPMGPRKSTDGSWADPANAAFIDHSTFQSNMPLFGRNATGYSRLNDTGWFIFNRQIVKNLAYHDLGAPSGSRITAQIATDKSEASGQPYSIPLATDVRVLDSSGALQNVTQNAETSPLPIPVMTYVAASGNAGDTSVTVSSAAGMAIGMRFFVACDSPYFGTGRRLYVTTITGIVGNVVSFSGGLPYGTSTGNHVTALTAAGANPAGWVAPEDYLLAA